MSSTPPPRFWAQRTLPLLDKLKGQLSPDDRKLLAMLAAQCDALHHVLPTMNGAQRAQVDLVIGQTMSGFEMEES